MMMMMTPVNKVKSQKYGIVSKKLFYMWLVTIFIASHQKRSTFPAFTHVKYAI